MHPLEPEELSRSLLGHKKTQQCLDLCNCNMLATKLHGKDKTKDPSWQRTKGLM